MKATISDCGARRIAAESVRSSAVQPHGASTDISAVCRRGSMTEHPTDQAGLPDRRDTLLSASQPRCDVLVTQLGDSRDMFEIMIRSQHGCVVLDGVAGNEDVEGTCCPDKSGVPKGALDIQHE